MADPSLGLILPLASKSFTMFVTISRLANGTRYAGGLIGLLDVTIISITPFWYIPIELHFSEKQSAYS